MQMAVIVFNIVILIASVVVHELAHGYMADSMGDRTARLAGRLTLNPLRHLDWFGSLLVPLILVFSGIGIILGWAKPVPFNPYNLSDKKWGGAKVALAGPLSNILVALLFGLVMRVLALVGIDSIIADFVLGSIVFINVILAVFNLIPVPPLDGHHILFAAIGHKYPRVVAFMQRYSIALFLVVVFVLWQYIAPVALWLFQMITGSSFGLF